MSSFILKPYHIHDIVSNAGPTLIQSVYDEDLIESYKDLVSSPYSDTTGQYQDARQYLEWIDNVNSDEPSLYGLVPLLNDRTIDLLKDRVENNQIVYDSYFIQSGQFLFKLIHGLVRLGVERINVQSECGGIYGEFVNDSTVDDSETMFDDLIDYLKPVMNYITNTDKAVGVHLSQMSNNFEYEIELIFNPITRLKQGSVHDLYVKRASRFKDDKKHLRGVIASHDSLNKRDILMHVEEIVSEQIELGRESVEFNIPHHLFSFYLVRKHDVVSLIYYHLKSLGLNNVTVGTNKVDKVYTVSIDFKTKERVEDILRWHYV